jgi:hypothetical protein
MSFDLIFGVYRYFQQFFSHIMAISFSGGRSRMQIIQERT